MFERFFWKSEKKILKVPIQNTNEVITKNYFNPNTVEEVRFNKKSSPTIVYLNLISETKRIEVPVDEIFAHSFIKNNDFKLIKPIGEKSGAIIYVNPENITQIYQTEGGQDPQYTIILLSGFGYRLAPDCPLRRENTL